MDRGIDARVNGEVVHFADVNALMAHIERESRRKHADRYASDGCALTWYEGPTWEAKRRSHDQRGCRGIHKVDPAERSPRGEHLAALLEISPMQYPQNEPLTIDDPVAAAPDGAMIPLDGEEVPY